MNAKKTKVLSTLLAFVMALMLLPVGAGAAQALGPVQYLYRDYWGDWYVGTVTNYLLVTESTTHLANLCTYVVQGEVEIDGRLTVDGRANLILLDGCKLITKGITAAGQEDDDKQLNIYAQSESLSTMGELIADASDIQNAAGIGGGAANDSSMPIHIYGGKITAKGGPGGAGIGGSYNVTSPGDNNNYHRGEGTVSIYGGHVTATGGRTSQLTSFGGAGIGGGDNSDRHQVAIYGGTVIANPGAGSDAPGIGSGTSPRYGMGVVTIWGGSVKATISANQDHDTNIKNQISLTLQGASNGELVYSYQKSNGDTEYPAGIYVDGSGKVYLRLDHTEHGITKIITSSGIYELTATPNTYAKQTHTHSWGSSCDSVCSCGMLKERTGHALVYESADGGSTIREDCRRSGCSYLETIGLELKPNASLTYDDGKPIEPLQIVMSDGWEHHNIDKLTIEYSNNTQAGTGKGKIKFISYDSTNYLLYQFNGLTVEKSFTIAPVKFDDVLFPMPSPLQYGQKLADSLFDSGSNKGSFAWKDGSIIPNAGENEYPVVFTPNDPKNYDYSSVKGYNEGSKTVERMVKVLVSALDLEDATIGEIPEQTYTGEQITPPVTVVYGSKPLEEGTDYTVSCTNNINQGTATVTITGTGNYTGTKTVTFAINHRSIETADVEPIAAVTYTGSAHTPEPEVKDDLGNALVKDTHYTLSYTNNTDQGTASVIITGMGNYTGTKTVTFMINPRSITNVAVEMIAAVTYTGSAHTPKPVVKDGSAELILDRDYKLDYGENLNAGTAKVTITGIGNYEGSRTETFAIEPKALSNDLIAQIPDQVYQGPGVEIEPEITVKDGEPSIITDADYTIAYQNNTEAGEAKVILTGTGNYTGTAERVFNILPADSQLTPGSQMLYTYGDKMEITFKPERKAQTFRRFASMQTEENQAWLMFGDTVLAGPVEAKEGVTGTLSYDTTLKLLPLGTHELKVVYTGGGNLNGTEETHTVTLNAKPLTALVDGDVRKVYDGSAAFKNVPLLISGVVPPDIVGAYADGDAADANVAEGLAFSVADQSAVRLSGKDAKWYRLAAEDISGTVSIDQAPQAAPVGVRGVVEAIHGVTPDMEYSTSPDGPWIRCTGDRIERLIPGTYYVRYVETHNYLPGEAAEVVVLPQPPATGDQAHPAMWMALMMLSLLTLASVHKSKTKA